MINYYETAILENEHLYGPGKRLIIWVQGCSLRCDGCVNEHLWSFDIRKNIAVGALMEMLDDSIEGITLHGGEPLDQSEELFELCKRAKKYNKTIILFTGYKKVELEAVKLKLWNLADIVVCGRFEKEKVRYNLQFKGSTNQRVITHKGQYKKYRCHNGKQVALLDVEKNGAISVKGFLTEDIKKIYNGLVVM